MVTRVSLIHQSLSVTVGAGLSTIQSALGLLTVDPARLEEIDLLIEILAETAFWLQARGIAQWQWQWPPPPGLRDKMADKIEQGDVYLARAASNQYAIGALRFEWQDVELWHDANGEAGYVHSLAVRPHLHGHKLGETLIEWAKTHVRSRNRNCLRLDCVASNVALRNYYAKLGFRYCGEATHKSFTAALYEIEL